MTTLIFAAVYPLTGFIPEALFSLPLQKSIFVAQLQTHTWVTSCRAAFFPTASDV